jgi:hypothetical protein
VVLETATVTALGGGGDSDAGDGGSGGGRDGGVDGSGLGVELASEVEMAAV